MKIDLTEGERQRIVHAVEYDMKRGGIDIICDPVKLIKKMKIKRECECCGGSGFK